MGFFGDLFKEAALELGQAIVEELLDSADVQNGDAGIDEEENYTDSIHIDEYTYEAIKSEIAQRPFEEIQNISVSETSSMEEKVVAADIINERLDYLHNLSYDTFSSFDDEELLEYYMETLEKSEYSFGSYCETVINAVYGAIKNRNHLHAQYFYALFQRYKFYPYSTLEKVVTKSVDVFCDDTMVNVAKSVLEQREASQKIILSGNISYDDEQLIDVLFNIRKLKSDYLGISYLRLCEFCSQELCDYRDDDVLINFLNMLITDDYKNLCESSRSKLEKIASLRDSELSYDRYDEFDRMIANHLLSLNNEED